MSSSSSTEAPSQVPPLISEPSMSLRNGESGDIQSRESGVGDESHSVNRKDEVVRKREVPGPSMSFFQGSSNVKIDNSNFNEIHGNATIIQFGDGQFTEVQRNIICDYIGNLDVLPGIRQTLNRTNLIQAIINLPRAKAMFNDYQNKKKSGPCFKGTREALLREMADWATSSSESRMYILSGLAGIGKSTVSYTIASRAADLNLLGASFFFSRDEADRKNAEFFFTTIAYQLCVYNATFSKAIGDVLLTERGSAATTKDPDDQLQALIVDPLQSIVQSRARPILVVIDALDECDEEDALSVLIGLKQLVRTLPSFKVILTTRPQPRLDHFFGRQDDHKIFHLQDIENKIVDNDIRLYLNHSLSVEKVQERLPTSQWCASDKEVDALVCAAGRLFIIASTIVLIILDKVAVDPADQMERLLDTFAQDRMPFKDLNEFYTVILRNVVPTECDANIANRYQSIVGAIIFIQHPLPITTLAHLIDIDEKKIRAVLVNLRSVILLGDDDIPQIYHKSFPDYITDLKLCQDIKLRVDPIMCHMHIVTCCFQIMNRYLKRNILGLGDPARFMSNEDGVKADGITDEQIQEKIPQQLRYACVYWVNHLEVANMEDNGLMNELERFAHEHILYWLEVLSLIGRLDLAHRAIGVVLILMTSTSSELHQLLSDVLRFISRFYEIIKRSALHTYYSALPFTPTDSILYRRYIKEAEHNICSIEGGPEKWGSLVANLRHEEVNVIKFSLDSTLLVACSEENVSKGKRNQGKLKIWDAATGTPISMIPGQRFALANDLSTVASSQDNTIILYNMDGSPSSAMFTTSSKIENLALSSESSRVAAALSDGTVWLWNSGNAELIDRFNGIGSSGYRPGSQPQLEFSRTGTRLACSLADGTKLRDGISGRFITDLRRGSSHKFQFSGDGSRIASQSPIDLTLWNSESGGLIAAVRDISGHMAISSNGSFLATADLDQVTLWRESRDSLAKIKILKVHLPNSMAFLPDNILAIASPSDIKLYNVNTHSFIHTLPFSGPRIAFSPDCTHLAIGDNYIGDVKLCDFRDIDASSPPSKGDVAALAFSRDCLRLACGFRNGIVELWETSPIMQQIDLRSKREKSKSFVRIFVQSRKSHHKDCVGALGFDPDGALFASGSYDGTIKLWNCGDGILCGTLKAPGMLEAVALSNNVLVAVWRSWKPYATGVTLWSLDTLRPIHTFKTDDIPFRVSIAENNTLIAVCFRDSHVTLFDVVNRTAFRTFDIPSNIHTISFLPDNSHLVVQSNDGVFQSFNLINNHITEGPTLEHLVKLPNTSLWRPGVPIWHREDNEQHYFAALFSQHQKPVPVVWIPKQIRVTEWTQGSSMIALGCEDGRVILLRLSTSHVS